MIVEQSLHVKATNCKAKVTFYTLLSLFAVTVVFYLVMSYLGINKHGLVGLLALALVTAAILIYTKYLSPIYYYDITHDSDGVPVFVVRQIIGKRQSTLCRISLADIASIEAECRAERRKHKTPYGYRKYNYIPTLIPEKTYRITLRSRHESSEMVIEVPDTYAEMLTAYVGEAKALAAEREASEPW